MSNDYQKSTNDYVSLHQYSCIKKNMKNTYCNYVHADQDLYCSVGRNTLVYFKLPRIQISILLLVIRFWQFAQTEPALMAQSMMGNVCPGPVCIKPLRKALRNSLKL